MKRSLRLERALDALTRERKHVQRDAAEVAARRSRMTTAIARLRDCRSAVAGTHVVDTHGRLNRDVYLVMRDAEDRMTREMSGLAERLARFDHEITSPVQERLRAAAVRERAVQTLVERRKESLAREMARKERLQLDELGGLSWRRRRK